jgi:hypothetical protein
MIFLFLALSFGPLTFAEAPMRAHVPNDRIVLKTDRFTLQASDIKTFLTMSIPNGYRSEIKLEHLGTNFDTFWSTLTSSSSFAGHERLQGMSYKLEYVIFTVKIGDQSEPERFTCDLLVAYKTRANLAKYQDSITMDCPKISVTRYLSEFIGVDGLPSQIEMSATNFAP